MEYKDVLKDVIKYIHHLEETILNYESKLSDMELEDMIEKPVIDLGLETPNRLINKQTHEEWAYSKTEGYEAKARREALAKAQASTVLETKKHESLEKQL